MRLGFAGVVVAASVCVTGCTTYKITALEGPDGIPPKRARIYMGVPHELEFCKATEGWLGDDGTMRGSLAVQAGWRLTVIVYVPAELFSDDPPKPRPFWVLPPPPDVCGVFECAVPDKGQSVKAELRYASATPWKQDMVKEDRYFQSLQVWVERK